MKQPSGKPRAPRHVEREGVASAPRRRICVSVERREPQAGERHLRFRSKPVGIIIDVHTGREKWQTPQK